MSIKKDDFTLLKKLFDKHPWLNDRFDGLTKLLFEDCKVIAQKELVSFLLEKMYYIDASEYRESIKTISEVIIDSRLQNNTIIYASAYDRKPDSSQELVYKLKVHLAELGWRKPNIYSQINKLKDINEGNHIFIVDEFIGTGQTMYSRFTEVQRMLKDKKFLECTITIISVTGTQEGVKYLKEQDIDIQVFNELPKGISDNYKDKEKYLDIMRDLETVNLAPISEDEVLPSLGYGGSEALYKREDGNTPNNVFPIFWWPKDINEFDSTL